MQEIKANFKAIT